MLEFENVTLLTYQHTPTFFEAGLRFKIQKTFTIVGRLLDQSATEGVANTWAKAEAQRANADDYQSIILNGIDFGVGRIISIGNDAGNHVQDQQYTYNIVAYSEGNLFNATDGVYDGIDWSTASFIDRLDSEFSYTLDASGDKIYEHNINVKFNRNPSNLGINPIDLAKDLAESLFEATNLANFLGDYDGHPNAKKVYTESYNKIDFSCSFSEQIRIPSVSQGNYSISFTYNIQLSEQGITTVSEKGSIQGITEPVAGSASAGYAAEAGDSTAYARANAVYGAYAFSTLPLHSVPIQREVVINKFEGTIEFTLLFTNDPRVDDTAVWDYTISINRALDNHIEITESGTVKGLGRPRRDKYTNALAYYNTNVLPSIEDRITAAYTGYGGTHVSNLMKVKEGFARAEFVGQISYSQVWTDDPLYTPDGNIRRQEITVATNYPTHLTVSVKVLGLKEIIQPQNNSTIGSRTVNIKLKGKRTTTMSQYLAYAKGLITTNGYNTIGEDIYIGSAHYTLSREANDFSLSVTWAFHGFYKAFGELALT